LAFVPGGDVTYRAEWNARTGAGRLRRQRRSTQDRQDGPGRAIAFGEVYITDTSEGAVPIAARAENREEVMRRWKATAILAVILLTAAALGMPHDARALEEGTPTAQGWDNLPRGTKYTPIRHGTADDLQTASSLVAVARITIQQVRVSEYYGQQPGAVEPHVLFAEQGVLRCGPHKVPPGSSPGPTLLIQAATDSEADEQPAVVLPGSEVDLHPGELIFFPADTGFKVGNDEESPITYLEIAVFPTSLIMYQPGQVVEGVTAQPLAPDVGVKTAYPPAPQVIAVGRLAIKSGTGIPSLVTNRGPRVFYVERGTLTVVGHEGKMQVKRGDDDAPGDVVDPGAELRFAAGDAFMLPPGAVTTLRNEAGKSASLLTVDVSA
jgi:hypothetical protein